VRGCRHFAFGCEHSQKGLDLRRAHVTRMPHWATMPRPSNEEAHPIQVNLFGTEAIVHAPNSLPHLVKPAHRLQRRVAGFMGELITV
jgi:hypothetical protein